MTRSEPTARVAHLPRRAGRPIGELVVPLLAAVAVSALLTAVPTLYVLAAALAVAGTYAVCRLPVISLSLLVVASFTPMLFQMTGRFPLSVPAIPGKLSLADAIMVAMLIAVVLRSSALLVTSRGRTSSPATALAVSCGLLVVWIAFSIVRNLAPYGIHTIGQFRYSYLVLAVPAYAALFLRTPTQRRRFVVVLLALSVGVTLAVVPLIGIWKGWGIGPGSRFFPAPVSLSLLFGWVALLVISERAALPVPKWLARALGFPVAVMLIVDSHRSVWLAGLTMLAYLLVAGRAAATTIARVAALAAAVIAVVLAVATIRGFDILGYVVTRGSALVDPSGDHTSTWRLDLWESNLRRWWQSPWTGDGFGGYYAGNVAQGVSQNIQTHSAYVQALVVLGAVGLALLAAVTVAVWLVLRREVVDARRRGVEGLDAVLVELGLAILAGTLAFGIVYPVTLASCIWVGVALAAAAGLRLSLPDVRQR